MGSLGWFHTEALVVQYSTRWYETISLHGIHICIDGHTNFFFFLSVSINSELPRWPDCLINDVMYASPEKRIPSAKPFQFLVYEWVGPRVPRSDRIGLWSNAMIMIRLGRTAWRMLGGEGSPKSNMHTASIYILFKYWYLKPMFKCLPRRVEKSTHAWMQGRGKDRWVLSLSHACLQ